jgi:hypothetical protein
MSHLRRLKRETTSVLTQLGKSPEEIATALRAASVQGVPKDNHFCAIAVYLTSLMGAEPSIRSVTVGPCSLLINLVGPNNRPAGNLLVQLPKPVRQFVAGFDALQYPTVVRPLHHASTAPLQSGCPT